MLAADTKKLPTLLSAGATTRHICDCRTMANMSAINERWNIWIRSVDLSRELRPEICEDPQVRFPVSVATTGGYAEDEGPSGRCCVVESRILSMGR